MLELRNVVKHYRVGSEPIRAVDGVSLDVQAGELVALYGPSGSGKTTLLDLIAGFQVPDRGTIHADGKCVSDLTERQHADYLLRTVGIIGGPEYLLPGATARENASLKLWRADMKHADERIEPVMERLGLRDRMEHPVRKLSMGERQRVLIAQALALDPKLVLADEPTGNLDTVRSREVLAMLHQIAGEQQAAVLLVTHDPQAVAFADRVLSLRDGQLHDYDPDELFMRPEADLAP
jgi:putative ABC transport system ATP-binding protein